MKQKDKSHAYNGTSSQPHAGATDLLPSKQRDLIPASLAPPQGQEFRDITNVPLHTTGPHPSLMRVLPRWLEERLHCDSAPKRDYGYTGQSHHLGVSFPSEKHRRGQTHVLLLASRPSHKHGPTIRLQKKAQNKSKSLSTPSGCSNFCFCFVPFYWSLLPDS